MCTNFFFFFFLPWTAPPLTDLLPHLESFLWTTWRSDRNRRVLGDPPPSPASDHKPGGRAEGLDAPVHFSSHFWSQEPELSPVFQYCMSFWNVWGKKRNSKLRNCERLKFQCAKNLNFSPSLAHPAPQIQPLMFDVKQGGNRMHIYSYWYDQCMVALTHQHKKTKQTNKPSTLLSAF